MGVIHHFLLARLVLLLSQYGYAVLFPMAVVEGPLAATIGGAFVASGEFDFIAVFFLLVLADTVGDLLYYSLGRFGHTRFLGSIGRELGITPERLAPLSEGFKKHDAKLLLLGKTQALGSVVLYFAGATRMRLERFILWNLIGTLPKVFLFELVGYFLGQSVLYSTRYVNDIAIATFAMAVILLLGYWLAKRYLEATLAD